MSTTAMINPTAGPRAAAAAAAARAAASASTLGARLWSALEGYGQRRAAAELRLLGLNRAASDPDLSRELYEIARRVDAG